MGTEWRHFKDEWENERHSGSSSLRNFYCIEGIVRKLGICREDIKGDVLVIGTASYFAEVFLVAGCPFCDELSLKRGVTRVVAIDGEMLTVGIWALPWVLWDDVGFDRLVEKENVSSYTYAHSHPDDRFDVITMLRISNLTEQLDAGLGADLSGMLKEGGIAVLSGDQTAKAFLENNCYLRLLRSVPVAEYSGIYPFDGHMAYLCSGK